MSPPEISIAGFAVTDAAGAQAATSAAASAMAKQLAEVVAALPMEVPLISPDEQTFYQIEDRPPGSRRTSASGPPTMGTPTSGTSLSSPTSARA